MCRERDLRKMSSSSCIAVHLSWKPRSLANSSRFMHLRAVSTRKSASIVDNGGLSVRLTTQRAPMLCPFFEVRGTPAKNDNCAGCDTAERLHVRGSRFKAGILNALSLADSELIATIS